MKLKIYPSKITKNSKIHLPPSKSITHRAIICATLASGKSVITNVELSDDIKATIEACKQLGATMSYDNHQLTIIGNNGIIPNKPHEINCNESGSTLRFTIPIFSILDKNTIFVGKKALFARPLDVYKKIFEPLNLMFVKHEDYLSIHGPLEANNYVIDENISSQFVSGLLFALPMLANDSTITIKDNIGSYSYILLTIYILKQFNINVEIVDKNKFFIPGKQHYEARYFEIEGDLTQFSYLSLLGILNNQITFLDFPFKSIQGDLSYLDILSKLNIKLDKKEHQLTLYPSSYSNITVDVENCIDVSLALCALAAYSKDSFTLTNVKRLEYKESNRIEAIIEEFKKLNIRIIYENNNLTIYKKEDKTINRHLDSHNDHRIFMALFFLAINENKPVTIDNFECINKSFPSFLDLMKSLNIRFEIIKK